jgi:hypothetical protein
MSHNGLVCGIARRGVLRCGTIKSIRHKGLKRLFEDNDPRTVTSEPVEKLRDKP